MAEQRPFKPTREGSTPSAPTALARAALRRCPVCGHGGLFRLWFQMVERCPGCGLRFERIEGHWLGSLGLNTIVSFVLLFAVIAGGLILTAPDFPVPLLTGLAVATAVLVPLLFFPFSRTLWTAIDLLMRPLESGETQQNPPGRA